MLFIVMTSPTDLLPSCLLELADHWPVLSGASSCSIKLSENKTYSLKNGDDQWILRLTPKNHRTDAQIIGELTFMRILNKRNPNISVCTPVSTAKGNLLASVSPYHPDESWWAVIFFFAKGCNYGFNSLSDVGVIEEWGRTMGRMHKVSSQYGWKSSPDTPEWNNVLKEIPYWHETHFGALSESRINELAQESCETAKRVAEDWKALRIELNQLPTTNEQFGVIHGDMNLSNFFVEKKPAAENILHVFDFDQIQLAPFGCDIGAVINGAQFLDKFGWAGNKIEGLDHKVFTEVFMRGYEKEYQHVPSHLIEFFCRFTELYKVSISLDILDKIEKKTESFDEGISSFVQLLVDRYPTTYE